MKTRTRRVRKKAFLRRIHLQAIFFLSIYVFFSKTIGVYSLVHKNILISFLLPYIYGSVAGVVFLYLFRHKDFFHFMEEVERIEDKREKGYLKKYLHLGKVLSIVVIGILGGPIFSSLTARLLLPRENYAYLLIILVNIPSTIVYFGLSRSVISVLWS